MTIAESLAASLSPLGQRVQRMNPWKGRVVPLEQTPPGQGPAVSGDRGPVLAPPLPSSLQDRPSILGAGQSPAGNEPSLLPPLAASGAVSPSAAPGPAAENIPPPETPAGKDDLMDLFVQSGAVNERLQLLATGLGKVNSADLVAQCREVALLLEGRRRMYG